MGFVGQLIGGLSQASLYDGQKKNALFQGEANRNKYYAQATQTEEAGRAEAEQAGANMMTARQNQRLATGSARASQAGTGFTSQGTGSQAERSVNMAYEKQISDMARSASVGTINAFNQATSLRRQGDIAYMQGEAEAAQYRAMAKATRSGLWASGISAAVGAGVGMYKGSQGANAYNASVDKYNEKYASQIADGTMEAMQKTSVFQSGLIGGLSGSGDFGNLTGSFNPFLARYVPKGSSTNFLNYIQ